MDYPQCHQLNTMVWYCIKVQGNKERWKTTMNAALQKTGVLKKESYNVKFELVM